MDHITTGLMETDTVFLGEDRRSVCIIDQTLLPGELKLLKLTEAEAIWEAIYKLRVRGAPAIGVTAALGMAVLVARLPLEGRALTEADRAYIRDFWQEKADYLVSSRPTAVNLSWAVERMTRCFTSLIAAAESFKALTEGLLTEAERIYREDIQVCRKLGENGLTLLKPGDGVLTHCNAGRLAAVRYGTATAPLYLAHEKGYGLKVYCDETRPLLQGARLTAYELAASGMDVTLLCDNMSASLMRSGAIQAVIVGADRIAANGDTANKIGTSMAALAARRYRVPFYVAAPTSTLDLTKKSGADIPIEFRKDEEVTELWYKERMAPQGIHVYNPAFDVTDAELITGIITEYGVAYPPFTDSLAKIAQAASRLGEEQK